MGEGRQEGGVSEYSILPPVVRIGKLPVVVAEDTASTVSVSIS